MDYSFLHRETAPQLFVHAWRLRGTKEIVGKKHNPAILAMFDACGWEYINDDETPWCGAFIGYCAKAAGLDIPKIAIRASEWANWGTEQKIAMFGDVLVFSRKGGGHVGIYVAEDDECYHVLGGNQGNAVNVTRIEKSRCTAIRRTPWKVGQPKNVRVIKVLAEGEISKNEA